MAMKDEYDALINNKTWDLVPRPSNANVIRSLWIFRHKKKSDGSFERYKARLEFSVEFAMKDLSPLSYFLGISIVGTKGVSQKSPLEF